MEQAARKRVERLKNFQLGMDEPIVTAPSTRDDDGGGGGGDDCGYGKTAESMTSRLLRQQHTLEGTADDSHKESLDKRNWDLKKEYERKSIKLEQKRRERIQEYINSVM